MPTNPGGEDREVVMGQVLGELRHQENVLRAQDAVIEELRAHLDWHNLKCPACQVLRRRPTA